MAGQGLGGRMPCSEPKMVSGAGGIYSRQGEMSGGNVLSGTILFLQVLTAFYSVENRHIPLPAM